MYKKYLSLLFLLAIIPGCGHKKSAHKHMDDTMTQVDIPVADETSVKSFFDENLDEFALVEDGQQGHPLTQAHSMNEYAWVEDEGDKSSSFKVVYFDFDKYSVKNTQEENLSYDVDAVKRTINQLTADGSEHPNVHIIVEGHACHSAGSALYNLALSEKRAKAIQDRLIAQGIPSEYIKIVGRGQEVPAIMNGKMVTGSRDAQWPNRRVELRLLA